MRGLGVVVLAHRFCFRAEVDDDGQQRRAGLLEGRGDDGLRLRKVVREVLQVAVSRDGPAVEPVEDIGFGHADYQADSNGSRRAGRGARTRLRDAGRGARHTSSQSAACR